ncbi:MAG: sugar phosphate isomerase/epimerase family protein [Candidatus Humimicrobiaceae bacterium]
MKIIVEEIGLKNVQISLDLFSHSLQEADVKCYCFEIKELMEKYKVKISSTFTGLTAYIQNMLGHPNPLVRGAALKYYENAIDIASYLGSLTVGGHFISFSVKDFYDKDRVEYMTNSLYESIIYLSGIAKLKSLNSITWGYMPSQYEPPHAINEAEKMIKTINKYTEVPVYLTLDLGHMVAADLDTSSKDRDVYYVLEKLLPYTNIVHLQQSYGTGDHHWPFTSEFNKIGIIKPEKVLKVINGYSGNDIDLIFEILPACELSADQIINDQKESAAYWKKYINKR